MHKFTCFTIVAVFMCCTSAVRIKNCGSDADIDYANVKITGCSREEKSCIFKKNHTAQLSIPFTAKHEISSLKASVSGIIAGIPIPFPLPNPEACGQSLTCPVLAQTGVTYEEGLLVQPSYPSITLTMRWELVSQNGVKEVCLLIPVQLQ